MTHANHAGQAARVVRGTLVSFTASNWTALVMLEGSLAEVSMPVLESCPAQLLAADDEVAVLLFGDHDPGNGVILGPFGAAGLLSSYLDQAEVAPPAAPASGYLRWFAHSTHSWGYFTNDGGAAVPAGLATVSLPLGAAELSGATRVFVQTNHPSISFADAADQSAYWTFKLPPGWPGRIMSLRLLWAPSSTNTGNCLWQPLIYRQATGVTLLSTSTDFLTTLSAGNGVADRAQLVTAWSGDLDLAGFADGECLSLRLLRPATNVLDTFTGAARLLALELSVVG